MKNKKRPVSAVLTAVVMLLIVQAAFKLLAECSILPNLFSPWLVVAVLLAVVYRVVNAFGWALVLRAMNQQVNRAQATKIWLLSESRRWLPGGVWGYTSRASQAKELNVSVGVASASMLLELILTLLASLFVVAPVAIVYRTEILAATGSIQLSMQTILLAMVAGIAVAAFAYTFRSSVAKKWNGVRNRIGAFRDVKLSIRGLVIALLFYVGMAGLNGFVTLALLWSLPAELAPGEVVIAATSLAWIVGFFAIFAPGGLFVREAILAVCLAPWIPYGTGIALAILARLLQIATEFVCLIFVFVPATQRSHRTGASQFMQGVVSRVSKRASKLA